MVQIEELIKQAKAQRSILMSFCASITFFERELLDAIQQNGAGQVTIFIGEADYVSSLADFSQSAGIRYRICPIRLNDPHQAFHPKLYFSASHDKMDLVVASANLTPSGFRSNLEIVDRLAFSADEHSDARAFRQYGNMLSSLVSLDPTLPSSAAQALNGAADEISKRLSDQVDESGPHFLHSVDEPLLNQLASLVNPEAIREIVCVSPFFDPQSKSITEFLKTFKNAKLRLVKDGSPDSLNGEALADYSGRVVVDEFNPAPEAHKKMHAKLIALHGKERSWLISGSANMTRPAWLASARSNGQGNVEAILLREVDKKTIKTLLDDLPTRRVEHANLHFLKTIEEGAIKRDLTILDAQLSNAVITVLVRVSGQASKDKQFRLFLEQGGCRQEAAVTNELKTDGTVVLRSTEKWRAPRVDSPLLAIVQLTLQGKQIAARSWVNVPSMLSLNASQRKARHSVKDVCGEVFASDDESAIVAEALSRFLDGVFSRSRFKASVSTQKSEKDAEGKEIAEEDFIIPEEQLAGVHASAGRSLNDFGRLGKFLRELLLAEDEDSAPSDALLEEPEENTSKDQKQTERGADKKQGGVLLEKVTKSFLSTAYDALSQEVSEATVPLVLNLPQAVVGFVLMHRRVCKRLGIPIDHTLTHELREMLRQLLSIDGVFVGREHGWLIRALEPEASRIQIRKTLADSDFKNQLLAFVALGLVLEGPIGEHDAVAEAILGGAHFIVGNAQILDLQVDLASKLTEIAGDGQQGIGATFLERVLSSFSPTHSRVLKNVRRWTLLKQLDTARRLHADLTGLRTELAALSPELLQHYDRICEKSAKPLAQVRAIESGICCEQCCMSLLPNSALRLFDPEDPGLQCSGKQHLLVPLSAMDPVTEMVYSWLQPLSEVRS
jgi:hypothetical protein